MKTLVIRMLSEFRRGTDESKNFKKGIENIRKKIENINKKAHK